MDAYTAHSPATDPGSARPWLRGLPSDVRSLAGIVNRLVVHQDRVPPEVRAQGARADEPRLRHAVSMLHRLRSLDDSAPTAPRAAPHRLVGHCRSSSVLLCSFLRETGTPARTRSGFSVYYAGGRDFFGDHWVTEHGITFDQTDVPRDQWLSAAEAWRRGRRDDAAWRWFGAHPSDVGMPYVAGQLLRDAAGVVRQEVGAFDEWVPGPLDAVLPQLDVLADLMLDDPDAEAVRSHLEAHPTLQAPPWALAGP